MREYPLEIEQMRDGWGVMGYYSKGHHDPRVFVLTVATEYMIEVNVPIAMSSVGRVWMRRIPVPGLGGTYLTYTKPGRGAFPVTVWEN